MLTYKAMSEKLAFLKRYMSPKLYRFVHEQRWAVAGFAVSLIALLVIVFTFLAEAVYFNDPRHKNEALKPWMTPHYVAMSYELPRPVVMEMFGMEKGKRHPRRMDKMAESMGLTLDELTAKVRETQKTYLESLSD